jgi:hypothetical protein
VAGLLAAGVMAASFVGLTAGPASAGNLGVALTRGETLNRGDWIERYTASGVVQLIMQNDGNLVLYLVGVKPCWATNTSTGTHAIYQRDGNFVLYGPGGALWASNTVGRSGQTVDMNSQGVLYVGNTPKTGPCRI